MIEVNLVGSTGYYYDWKWLKFLNAPKLLKFFYLSFLRAWIPDLLFLRSFISGCSLIFKKLTDTFSTIKLALYLVLSSYSYFAPWKNFIPFYEINALKFFDMFFSWDICIKSWINFLN